MKILFLLIIAVASVISVNASPESNQLNLELERSFDPAISRLFIFSLDENKRNAAVVSVNPDRINGVTGIFVLWLERILARKFLPNESARYQFFRRGLDNCDVVLCRWEAGGLSFLCAQTIGKFVLIAEVDLSIDGVIRKESLPQMEGISIFPEGMNLRTTDMKEIYISFYGKYLSEVTRIPKEISFFGPSKFLLGGKFGISDYLMRNSNYLNDPVSQKVKEHSNALLENDSSWYRNLSVWGHHGKVGIGFLKIDSFGSTPSGAIEKNRDWF